MHTSNFSFLFNVLKYIYFSFYRFDKRKVIVQFYGDEYDFPIEEDVRQGNCVCTMYTEVYNFYLYVH